MKVGEGVRAEAKTYNPAGELFDATSITLKVLKPDGTVFLEVTPTRVSTGTYRHDFHVDTTTGTWKLIWTAVVEGLTVKEKLEFEVESI